MSTPTRADPPAPTTEATGTHGQGVRAGTFELRTFGAFRYPDFRLLWPTQAFTGMGVWMDQVARGWLLYDLTSSPLQLGLVRGLQALPLLVLSPVAGTAADRYDRKAQVMLAQLFDGLMHAALAALILSGHIQP